MSESVHGMIDRSGWRAGEWDTEPDRLDFEHAGFACLLQRNWMGTWCGYVGVGPDHPLHGKPYSWLRGLNYAGACEGTICHIPKPGMPHDVWWFGFDCARQGDIAPGVEALALHSGVKPDWPLTATYKNIDYAKTKTEALAERLKGNCAACGR